MGVIHENLEDGAEITWQLRKCQQDVARRLVKSRTDLISSVESELGSKDRISDVGTRLIKEFIQEELAALKRRGKKGSP
jgi:hypothetical protein